jgi:hypothetical protein
MSGSPRFPKTLGSRREDPHFPDVIRTCQNRESEIKFWHLNYFAAPYIRFPKGLFDSRPCQERGDFPGNL